MDQIGAVAIKKGFLSEMLRVFKDHNIHIIMQPYYEACVALQDHDPEHLLKIAAEVRDAAKEIYERIDNYLN